MSPIRGLRYHCLDCPDYDLCEGCYNKEIHCQHKLKRKTAKGMMYNEEKSFFLVNIGRRGSRILFLFRF